MCEHALAVFASAKAYSISYYFYNLKRKIMNDIKVLLGFLGGVAVGATLGILFAPEKGAYTRMKISKKGGKYKDEMNGKVNDAIETLTDKYDSLKQDVARMVEAGKGKFEKTTA
jgi:gas vesicle protein